MKNLAIIMSGGTGTRLNSDVPKQLMKIGDKSLLEISISVFQEHAGIDTIFIVSHKDLLDRTKELVKIKNFSKVEKIISGGDTRQHSSTNGVNESSEIHENILIHDSARPFVSSDVISSVLFALKKAEAVTPVIDSSDTLVSTDANGLLNKYLARKMIKRVQTPQGFKRKVILKAHQMAGKDHKEDFTDDCSMIIYFGLAEVKLVAGDQKNIKITYFEDLKNLNG